MKLHCDPASPTTRRILVTAIEAGLKNDLEVAAHKDGPAPHEPAIRRSLGSEPVLESDQGRKIFGANAICEYLDGRHERPKMMARQGAARFEIDQLTATADALLTAALVLFRELDRPQAQRWNAEVVEQHRRMAELLDNLEEVTETVLVEPVTLGHIAVGCALAWLEAFLPSQDWRDGRAALARWYDRFHDRPSMRETDELSTAA